MAELALVTRLPHLPNALIYATLFQNVQNSAFLRQQLIDGNTDFEYAFIDAANILSTKHVLAACFRAINDAAYSRLRSRNVHSEIVFALNPSNNIAESFRRFGVQDTTTSLIAIKVLYSPEAAQAQIAQHLQSHVHGTQLPFTDDSLLDTADVERIRKVYKVPAPATQSAMMMKKKKKVTPSGGGGGGGGAGEDEGRQQQVETLMTTTKNMNGKISGKQLVDLEAVLLGSMAIKGS